MIKVADFGLTEDVYARNYFRHDRSEEGSEEKVPIRWMAPESIENDIYTERSDVVSVLHMQYSSHYFSSFVVANLIAVVVHMTCMLVAPKCFIIKYTTVVIWSNMLGDIHMWRSPLCWCSCHVSAESTPQWPQTGETQQCHLLR